MRDLSIIFLYSFSFYFLRLWLCPEALVNDEAQQFIDVANLALGYSKQAPLFTWFAALASSIFGLKIWLLSFLFHLYLFVFFLAFYFTMRYFQKANQALLSTAFLLLIPLYSYDLYRYMVHSVLMLACTALSLCLLVHLLSFYQELGGDFRLKLSLRWTYICLGISIALGILSKYNFLFFVLILFFLSLISKNLRKVLWGRYTPLCIVVTLFCLSPHLYWLSQNHYAPILHALSRAESGQADLAYSWKYFFDIYVFFFLFAFVFLCFFASDFYRGLRNPSKASMRWLFLEIILLSLSLPLLLTFMLRTACFDQRWLASIYVLFVFALFGIKSLSGICTEIKVSQLVVISLIIFSTFSLKALSYTVVLGPHTLARPNAAIARALKTSDSPIYVVEDLNLYGALKVQLPERNIYYVSKDKFLETSPSKALVLWNAAELKRFNPAAQQSHSRVRIEYIRLPYEHFDFAIRFRGLVQQLLSFRTSLISQELLKGEDLYYILGTYES